METSVAEPVSINVFDYRKGARRRALVCPGAGWAYLGRPMLGALTFGTTVAMLLAASYAAWRPSSHSAGTAAALLAAVAGLIAVEFFQTFIAWPSRQGVLAETAVMRRRRRIGAGVLTLAAVLLGTIIATSYRMVVIQGDGMAPTVTDGDRILCHMRVDRTKLTQGRLILFSCSRDSLVTTAGDHVLGRIIAGPGDSIEIRDGQYYVNDQGVCRVGDRGNEMPALTVPKVVPKELQKSDAKPHAPLRVPSESYFVVQDSPDRGRDSRVLSWVERPNVKSHEMFAFDRGVLPRRLE